MQSVGGALGPMSRAGVAMDKHSLASSMTCGLITRSAGGALSPISRAGVVTEKQNMCDIIREVK